MKIPALLLFSTLALLAPGAGTVLADAKIPGEIDALTDETRAAAQKHVDVIVKGGERVRTETGEWKCPPDVEKARRALLVMGPLVFPVVENAMRLGPPPDARPHFNLLKALLNPKAEPELDALRAKLRRTVLTGNWGGIFREVNEFRVGKVDPRNPLKRIPPTIQPVKYGLGVAFRTADGSIVIGFGSDADEKTPDCADFSMSEQAAGLVIGIGGRAFAYPRTSGHGSNVTVTAPLGFAYAWATDGAPGKAPGGTGGEGGAASADGGAGQFGRSGNGGAGAPADDGNSPSMK